MKKVLKKLRVPFAIIGIAALSFTTFSFTDGYFEIAKNLDIFASLFREINTYYVDETIPHVITTNKRKIGKGLTEYSLFNDKPTFLYEEDIMQLANEHTVELLGPIPKIWLGVPLRLENRTIGVIAVKSHSDRNKIE